MDHPKAAKPELIVDDDCCKAILRFDPEEGYQDLNRAAILAVLNDADVEITNEVTGRVEDLCRRLTAGELPGTDYVIAEARLPTPPVDGSFRLANDLRRVVPAPQADDQGNGRINYFAQSRLVTVQADVVIGSITPAQPAVAGADVLGRPIPSRGSPREVILGQGVRLGDDGTTVYSTTNGQVRESRGEVSVLDVIQIDGDVDFECGAIDVESDVVIKGTVRDLFHVRTTKAITIGGAIENTEVQAGRDILVRGGILGKERGEVRAGGKVVCKYCDAATVRADGDITITKEAIGSHLYTRGQLTVLRGALIGGTAYARGGARIKEVGSEAEVITRLTIGLDTAILVKAAEIARQVDKHLQTIEKMKMALAPLMAEVKRLLPAQREQASELLLQAKTIRNSCDEMVAEKERMIQEESWHEEPALTVTDHMFPAVELIFEDLVLIVREPIRGPVKIFLRRNNEGTPEGLVCVNALSGSRRELGCQRRPPQLPSAKEGDETQESDKAEVS